MRLARLLTPVGALALALLVGAAVIAGTGGNPIAAYTAMGQGAFGSTDGILRTLAKATPLLFSGLGVALALRAGLFNIGAEGQIVVGGLAAGVAGAAFKGMPIYAHLPLSIAAGILAGGIWGLIPGLLKAWRGTHEVIVTIMMNYIAFEVTSYLANGPLRESHATNHLDIPRTAPVLASARLWSISDLYRQYTGTNFSAGFAIALLAALLVAFLIRRTALGFEIRAVGEGPEAARANGIRVGRTLATAMALSGALAGLAGAVEVLAVHHRFLPGFSPGYGFDSIAVALLGGLNSFGVTLSAILFGGLNAGANAMELNTGIAHQLSGIVQAAVIVAVGIRYVRRARA